MNYFRAPLIGVVCIAALAGCANNPIIDFENDPNARTKVGAVSGAVIGAIVGNNVGDGENDLAGAAIGAAVGTMAGQRLDEKEQQRQRAIANSRN